MSVACDNLLCDGHGRQPNPRLAVNVLIEQSNIWVRYAHTEILEVVFSYLHSKSTFFFFDYVSKYLN